MNRANRCVFAFALFLALLAQPARAEELIPRTIIALYDDRADGDIRNAYIHRLAEMPLNHLGLLVEYHDIHKPLPDIAHRKDVRGVLTWFFPDTRLEATTYLNWALKAIENGKKYVVLGPLGVKERASAVGKRNRFLGKIGIKDTGRTVENPLGAQFDFVSADFIAQPDFLRWNPCAYRVMQAFGAETDVHLTVKDPLRTERNSILMATSPRGGYVSEGYLFRTNDHLDDEVAQWLIDPFAFFRRAFATDDLPKPDATTIAGRRIFYSAIDGDGLNNVTRIEEYRGKNMLSARVILEKIAKTYSDFPMMLAIIASEIDPAWTATQDSESAVRDFLALPNIEPASHTYSHPFRWDFFKSGNPDNEIPFLALYPDKAWQPKNEAKTAKPSLQNLGGYTIPRAYAKEPFDIHKEIEGSVHKISEVLPAGKKIEILAWSGNCSPWEEVIRMTRLAKLQNINGGDTRSDPDYPGYASVSSLGKQVGSERQIYISSSNENTYTNLWSQNFFAHRYLKATLENTETPLRLKPLTIYFHIYAGEREASLKALMSNFDYARKQNLTPVSVSHFTHIAQGFYDAQITAVEPDVWRIVNRGALDTIRFDRQVFKAVDFKRSRGVVGQRPFQGSLYVYLDSNISEPIIALKDNEAYFKPAEAEEPYLRESRWLVFSLVRRTDRLDFLAQGYGDGEMIWQVPVGAYRVSIDGKRLKEIYTAESDGTLKLTLAKNALKPLRITIERI